MSRYGGQSTDQSTDRFAESGCRVARTDGRTNGDKMVTRESRLTRRIARAAGKLGLWVLEHFVFLACLAVGIAAGTQGRAEVAIGLFILGSLAEVAASISEVRRDLEKASKRRCAECHPRAEESA